MDTTIPGADTCAVSERLPLQGWPARCAFGTPLTYLRILIAMVVCAALSGCGGSSDGLGSELAVSRLDDQTNAAAADDNPNTVADEGTDDSDEEAGQSASPASSGSRVLGDLQDDIEDIWYVADTGSLVQLANGLSSAFTAVVQFEDGTATTDGTFLSRNGIRASRTENPQRWGEARVQNGVFQYRLEGERSWLEPEFSRRTTFLRRGGSLTGCFNVSTGAIFGPTASIRVRTICTDAEGRFAFNSATASAGSSGGGTTSSESQGDYLIDGRAIRLDYDNGDRQELLFGVLVLDGFAEAVVLGSGVYHVD